MVTFNASTVDDTDQIQNWTDADVYHRGQHNAAWWITGNGLISFRLEDEKGTVFYVRVDEGEYAQVSIQFAPVEVVSKRRVVRSLLEALPKLAESVKELGGKGMVFNSTSPTLIKFMQKVGFVQKDDSYVLTFGE